jgi:cytidylate kinase
MKKEYDFAKAERGRFFKKGAVLRLPIYLDATVQDEVEGLASRTGRNVQDVVNRIVRRQVRLIEELETENERPGTSVTE